MCVGLFVVVIMIEERSGAEDVGRGCEFALMIQECWKKEIERAVENVKRKQKTARFG